MIQSNIDKILQEYMSIYGCYIITGRALPDLYDGLKPVQRRILYSMWLNKNFNFTKSAKIEGNTMALHPHGGSYGSMVNMVQKERQQLPLITGKGNFGSFLSKGIDPAAPRYTEAKLNDLSRFILEETKDFIVKFRPNYDGTLMEPDVLASKLPLVLFNPNSGIALGMSSSIGSFNINETVDAMIDFLQKGEKKILIPDFPTGGMIINTPEIFVNINRIGIGTVRLRAKYYVDGNDIVIYQLPYGVTKEKVYDKIASLIKSGRIKEVASLTDLTGLNGMKIEITVKKGTDIPVFMQKLFSSTPLESTFSYNMNMIYKGLPKVFGVWEVLERWLVWRKECLVKYTENLLNKDLIKLNILYGLERVLTNVDKTIEIIRFSEEEEIVPKLMNHFNLNTEQAVEISNMKIRNINKKVIEKKISQIKTLEKEIKDKKDIISDENRQAEIICNDLLRLKQQFGRERQTEIGVVDTTIIKKLQTSKKKEIEKEDLTPSIIFITKDGYIKKLTKDCDYNEHRMKEGDTIIGKYPATNSDEILVFAGTECHKIPVKNLPINKPSEFGTFAKTFLEIQENPVGIQVLNEENKFMFIVYEDGAVVKIDSKVYRTAQNRKTLVNSLRADSKVEFMTMIPNEDLMFKLVTSKKSIVKSFSALTTKSSRNSRGAKVFNGSIEKFENVSIYYEGDVE